MTYARSLKHTEEKIFPDNILPRSIKSYIFITLVAAFFCNQSIFIKFAIGFLVVIPKSPINILVIFSAADKLYVSRRTLERYVSAIYEKTGAKSRIGLISLYNSI